MQRSIRLKEWTPGTVLTRRPTEAYIANSDGSLLEKDYHLTIDEHGFIGSRNPRLSPANRIIVLGDSVVESMFVDEGHRFTDEAESQLQLYKHDTAIYNAGVTGMTTLHALNALANKIIPLKPRTVVLMTGMIDIDCALDAASYWTSQPYTPLATEHARQADGEPPSVQASFNDRTKLLKLIEAACREFDIDLVLATIAHRAKDQYGVDRGARFDRLSALRTDVNENTRTFARQHKIPLIDIEREFAGRSDLFYDSFHFNRAGARLAGDFLGKQLFRVLTEPDAVVPKLSPVGGGGFGKFFGRK